MIMNSYSQNVFYIGNQSYFVSSAYNSTVMNSFSFAIDEFGNDIQALYSIEDTIDHVYSLVDEGKATKANKSEILETMEDIWDTTIWDFVNLDADGNPTFIIQ